MKRLFVDLPPEEGVGVHGFRHLMPGGVAEAAAATGYWPERRVGGAVTVREGTDMSAREKAKAKIEQITGKVVRRVAHASGDDKTAAKGAALQGRGKARQAKEKGKDFFKR
ncbi:CsbD family protein [Streptomyces sp. NPDC004284]|uniref:CsbD family protein n=1 Tax=Streptomyces sp. NPDC004284 TaxID=3364695 RepID=UPI0036A38A92